MHQFVKARLMIMIVPPVLHLGSVVRDGRQLHAKPGDEPTGGLAMATAFHLLKNKEREFPLVRVFGTIGWIAVVTAMFVGGFKEEETSPRKAAAVAFD
jgi:Nucleoside H+ symporter